MERNAAGESTVDLKFFWLLTLRADTPSAKQIDYFNMDRIDGRRGT
jgi:hypothetical protein